MDARVESSIFIREEIELENDEGKATGSDIQNDNTLLASINKHLKDLPPLPTLCCIHKVPVFVRKVNKEAYTPLSVSIGPIHHRNKSLKKMNEFKWGYLKDFLRRERNYELEDYVNGLTKFEKEARQFYENENVSSVKSDEFVKMMLLDGCFIVELMLKDKDKNGKERYKDDPILNMKPLKLCIERDMLLLENQLPLFIIEGLLNSLPGYNDGDSCNNLIVEFFDIIIGFAKKNAQKKDIGYVRPCLSTSYQKFKLKRRGPDDDQMSVKNPSRSLASFLRPEPRRRGPFEDILSVIKVNEAGEESFAFEKKHFLSLARESLLKSSPRLAPERKGPYKDIKSVKKLHEAGVKFKIGPSTSKCFDITFTREVLGLKGVLKIPFLLIGDHTEAVFRNFIAYEQCNDVGPNFFTDYALLMDMLIDSPEDVGLLCKYGIINKGLGEDDAVARLFNDLCKGVVWSPDTFYYCGLCEDLNKYSKARCHRWMASLRHNYFDTPWHIFSLIAAIILLTLTLIQTVKSFK